MTDHIAYIGLGSNLGDPKANLNAALKALKNHPHISSLQQSSIYETKPLGRLVQPLFLNGVAKITTTLTVRDLFKFLQQTELELGRGRYEHWGPRTIDLDLLLFDETVINEPNLTVPHSQMHLRSFVLKGLCELFPYGVHPVLGRDFRMLSERLNGENFALDPVQAQLVSIAGNIGVGKTTLAKGLSERLRATFIAEKYDENPYLSDVYEGHAELALDSELYFLASGASQLKKDQLQSGQYYISDYVFDKALVYASAWLKGANFEIYLKHYHSVNESVTDPVVIVYLQDTLENCLSRIQERNRPYEQHIELSFLKHLADGYEKLYTEYTGCPVIRLQTKECFSDKQVDRIATEIDSYLNDGSKP